MPNTENPQGNNLVDQQLLLDIQEITRRKLARELHDGLTQTVSALAMRANFARRTLESDPGAALLELEKVEDLARETAREIRHMIFILHPREIASMGIDTALGELVEKMYDLYNLRIEFSMDKAVGSQLGVSAQSILYAVVEEAVDILRKAGGADFLRLRVNSEGENVQVDVGIEGENSIINVDRSNKQLLDHLQQLTYLVGGRLSFDPQGDNGNHIQVELPIAPSSTGSHLDKSE